MKKYSFVIPVISVIFLIGLTIVNQGAYSTFPGQNGKISFVSDRDGNYEIYIMDPDGSNQIRLTNNLSIDTSPAWSPDGKKIAFSSNRDGNLEIYIMDSDGSNQIRLTNSPGIDIRPSWSPDGQKIAFMAIRGGAPDIFVMNSDGSDQTNLTNNKFWSDDDPDWSPDGTKIAFTSHRDSTQEIYMMNSDGSNQINLSNDSSNDRQPSWSPDGNKIAFTSSGKDVEIFVMDSDGSNKIKLTENYPAFESSPFWSPDGTKIGFVSNRDYYPYKNDIYIMNPDGSNQIRISNNFGNEGGPPRWQSLNTPPDCDFIDEPMNVSSFENDVIVTSSISTTIKNTDLPPFHKTVELVLTGITDVDGDPVSLNIDAITQDEPTSGLGKGDKSPDGFGVGTDTASIRVERNGSGDGRIYEISFTVDDGNGGQCSSSRLVGIPHDNKKDPIDSGQIYNSTLP